MHPCFFSIISCNVHVLGYRRDRVGLFIIISLLSWWWLLQARKVTSFTQGHTASKWLS